MNKRLIIGLQGIIVCAVIWAPQAGLAQDIPPGQEPEAQASRFRAESEKEKKTAEKKAKAPEITISEAPPPASVKAEAFTLSGVEITGTTIFKPEHFAPIYTPYIGKKVTFDDLVSIADRIKAEYKKRGYLTTTAYIPEQSIEGGKIRISVVEGKMGDLKVEGNSWFPSGLIKKYIHSKKNEILNIPQLQKDILRLNQNPDVGTSAVLAAGKEPETSDIILKVADKFPHHGGVSVDNQGSRLTGRYRTSFSFRSTDLTANNDSLFVNASLSPGARGEFVSYNLPLNTYGTKFGFDFSYFTSKLRKEFAPFDITGDSLSYTPHVSNELYLSDNFQLNLDYGLEFKSIYKYSTGAKTTVEELRMPYFSYDLNFNDALLGGGQNSFSPKIKFSTANFLGSFSRNQPEASRRDTGGFFVKYEHSAGRTQVMPFASILSMRTQLQLSSRTLPSSEQFQLGGANSIRGYPEGDYLADDGASLNIDWIFPSYFIPKDYKLPMADRPLRNQLQPVAFLDLGGGYINKVMTGERKEKFLMGIGGGLRFNFNRNVSLRAEWAEAIGDAPTSGQGPSNFHLSFRFET